MADHELYLLHLGQLGLPDAETGETHFAQVPGYLIRTAEGRTVLVDTGNPVAVIGQPTAAPWWDHPNDTDRRMTSCRAWPSSAWLPATSIC